LEDEHSGHQMSTVWLIVGSLCCQCCILSRHNYQ